MGNHNHKGKHSKRNPGYTCYKDDALGKDKKAKAAKAKRIADGKKRAKEAALLATQR